MKPKKCCGTCNWHHKDDIGDWLCVNDKSPNCADWTYYEDACDEWEEKE